MRPQTLISFSITLFLGLTTVVFTVTEAALKATVAMMESGAMKVRATAAMMPSVKIKVHGCSSAACR